MLRAFLSFLFLSTVSAQTVYLAGDSTMALGGGGSGTQGWGVPFGQFLTIPVVNDAVAGTSARSYSDQGLFTKLIASVKSGDYVVRNLHSIIFKVFTSSILDHRGVFVDQVKLV